MSNAATQPNFHRTPRHYHHGKSPAAWAGAILTTIGFVIGTIGFIVPSVPIVVAGGIVVILALVVTQVMRNLGYGQAS